MESKPVFCEYVTAGKLSVFCSTDREGSSTTESTRESAAIDRALLALAPVIETVTSVAPKLLILLKAATLAVETQFATVVVIELPALTTTESTIESRATARAAEPGTPVTVTLAPLKFTILDKVAA